MSGQRPSLSNHEGWLKKIDKTLFGNGQPGLIVQVTAIKVQNRFIMGGITGILVLLVKQQFFQGA